MAAAEKYSERKTWQTGAGGAGDDFERVQQQPGCCYSASLSSTSSVRRPVRGEKEVLDRGA